MQAVHESFSIAIASTFWVSIVAALVAAVFVLFLREAPMRETFEMAPSDAEPPGSEASGRAGAGTERGPATGA